MGASWWWWDFVNIMSVFLCDVIGSLVWNGAPSGTSCWSRKIICRIIYVIEASDIEQVSEDQVTLELLFSSTIWGAPSYSITQYSWVAISKIKCLCNKNFFLIFYVLLLLRENREQKSFILQWVWRNYFWCTLRVYFEAPSFEYIHMRSFLWNRRSGFC